MEITLWASSNRTPCLALNHEYFPIFFPRNFSFMFSTGSFCIHFCMRCGTFIKVFGFCVFVGLPRDGILASLVGQVVSPSLNNFHTFVKSKLGIFVWVSFWGLHSALLICVSVPPPLTISS